MSGVCLEFIFHAQILSLLLPNVHCLFGVSITAERHLGIDVRVEQSFINCSFLVLREANDIIGYRTINDKEPEMFYSYLAYQLMKGK